NRMDAIWVPSQHTRAAFENAGVTAPLRVIPCRVGVSGRVKSGVPQGEMYDLDRRPPFAASIYRLARFRLDGFRASRWLLNKTGPRLADALRRRLRTSPRRISTPRERTLLCVGEDLPYKGLRLLLAEWMEYRRRTREGPSILAIRTTSRSPAVPCRDLVLPFWQHVQSLKRQLGVRRAGVFLFV